MPNSNNSPLFSPLGSEFIPFHPPKGEKGQHSYCPYLEDKVSSVKTASRKNGCKCCYEQQQKKEQSLAEEAETEIYPSELPALGTKARVC